MGLTPRLVLTAALLAAGVVVLDTALTRWALERRFLSYVQEQEAQALDRIADRLGELHGERGDLEGLGGRRLLVELARDGLASAADGRHDGRRERSRDPSRDPPGAPPGAPPGEAPRDGSSDERSDDVHPEDGAAPPPPHAGRHAFRFYRSMLPRLTIRDAAGTVVFAARDGGDDVGEPAVRTITGTDGVIVGRLELAPSRAFARESDRRFVREVGRLILWIALLAALVGSAVGWLLARRLVLPIRRVADGARALADGDYEVRLVETRSDELGALARDFNVLAHALERARRARQRWLADVAHELRTPLAVLRAEIDALRDGVRVADAAAIASLAAEMERLSRLVDDLHQLSLADAGALAYRFAPVDVTALVAENCERFSVRLAEAGLVLETDLADGPPVLADRARLDQLVGNLLENAARYTDAPGPVRVVLAVAGRGLVLTVEDGPPGVAAEEIDRLFDRFARAEGSRSRDHGGAGLGLALVRAIAEAHGGTASATVSDLGGLAVRVMLPRGGPSTAGRPPEGGAGTDAENDNGKGARP